MASVDARQRTCFKIRIDDRDLTFLTQPGVFSHDGADEGSLCLIEAVLPAIKPHMTLLDLGAGVGLIGIAVAGRLERGEVWLADTDLRALRLAEANIERSGLKNAHAVLSDIALDLPTKLRFDMVLTNPPTHSGKVVLQMFVAEAHAVLRPGGTLYVVVNRRLSVKAMMEAVFGNVKQVNRCRGFVVLRSEKNRLKPARTV